MRKLTPFLALIVAVGFTAVVAYAAQVSLEGNPPSGSTVSPGDTIHVTATITNDLALPDLVDVRVSLSVDDRTRARTATVRLRPNQTVQQSFAFTLPMQLNHHLSEPADVTVTIQARSHRTGQVTTDTLTYTLVPN